MTDSIYAWSQTAASNANADASINWAEFQDPDTVNDSARQMMARVAAYISDNAPKRSSTGTGNAYAVVSDAAGASLVNGMVICFIADRANTAAATLNVDGLGAKPFRPKTATEFNAGDLIANQPVIAWYNSATQEWLAMGTGYHVSSTVGGLALQNIVALLPKIGDVVLSVDATPAAGRIRLTETTQAVLKTSYPELNTWLSTRSYPWGSTATHFNLPPAAGYFLRFAATSTSIDTGGARAAGSTQADQNKSHTHDVSGTTAASGAHSHQIQYSNAARDPGASGGMMNYTGSDLSKDTTTAPDHQHAFSATSSTSGGDEVRVKNTAMHADIIASSAESAAQIAVFGFPYQWDTGTSAADPGAGRVRGNNASLGSITQLYINNSDRWSQSLAALWGALASGNPVHLSRVGAQGNRIIAVLNGAPSAGAGFYTLPVSVTVATGSFSNNDSLALEYGLGGTGGGGGSVATDAIWDAKGDLSVGTGANTAARLAVGTNGQFLVADSATSTGLKWASASGTGDLVAANNLSDVGNRATAASNLRLNFFSPMNYSAVGDGSADDTTPLANCITAAQAVSGGATIIIDKPYKITSALNITSSDITIEWRGQGKIIVSGSGSFNGAINVGTALASRAGAAPLTASSARRTNQITVTSVTGISVGHLIRIDYTNTETPASSAAFVSRVTAIATNTITLSHTLPWAVSGSSTSLAITSGTPVERVRLINPRIEKSSFSGSILLGIRFLAAYDCSVTGSRTTALPYGGIGISAAVECQIEDHYGDGDGGTGSGDAAIAIYGATACTFERMTVYNSPYFPYLLTYCHHCTFDGVRAEKSGTGTTTFTRGVKTWDCSQNSFSSLKLSDICGVGVFLENVSRDNRFDHLDIHVLKHSSAAAQGFGTNGMNNNDNVITNLVCKGTETTSGGSDIAIASGDLRNKFSNVSYDTAIINDASTLWGIQAAASASGGAVTATLPVAQGGTGATTAGAAATALGLGTSDSPQFTAVNVGAATDTTLARLSAGDLSVEGNRIFRAGGTDIPVADGGTGASTFTSNGVLIGAGASPIAVTAAAAANNSVLAAATAGGAPAFTSTPTIESLNLNTGATGLALSGTKTLYVSSSIYTAINDPSGVVKFFFGNASDPNTYMGSDNYFFREKTNAVQLAVLNGTGFESKNNLVSNNATAGVGYSAGAGGTVTQATSRSTGVTINKVAGAITLVSAAGSTTPTTFSVTNSAVAATDVIVLSQKSGTDKYILLVTAVAAGSFQITAYTTGGTTTEQPVINFAVLKAVAA